MREKVTAELKQTFRPEFLNRIDAVVVFHSLAKEQIRQIVDLELERVRKQLAEQEIELEVTEAAMDLLGDGLRPHLRGAPDAPDDPEPDRGSAGGGRSRFPVPVRIDGPR